MMKFIYIVSYNSNRVSSLIIHINQVDRNMYICHAGPSGHVHDDASLSYVDFSMDRPAPSPLPDDGAGMGGNLEGEDVYGLSNLRRSRRIAGCVEKIGQQQWRANAPLQFVSNREESDDDEEEDVEDDGFISDFDVDSDEGLEGYEEDDDRMFAGPVLEE